MSEKLEAYYGLPSEVKFCKKCVISNQRPSSTVEFKNEKGEKKFKVIDVNLKRYILINNDRFNIVLENMNKPKVPIELMFGFLAASSLLFVLYLWITRSLKPLSRLKNQIINFSEGNLDISCKSDQNDEIAEVANAFDYAAQKIRELLHSRQLLLRAIMHELKTPIAKGRLMSEMLSDNKQRKRFHTIFERLNMLIDEFAKVERIASKNVNAVLKAYKASDIIDASIDMLMLDDHEEKIIKVISQDYIIQADFDMFALAIKNLLDNGIKYSIDKKVQIVVRDNEIRVCNHGDKLKAPIEEYFTPFHAHKHGLGLGLYIIKNIADIHHMSITYKYEDGKNIFILT